MEKWNIVEWRGALFQVSNEGKVQKEIKGKYRTLKPFMNGTRAKVRFTQDGRFQYAPVALLIATAFIPNPDNRDYVEHIDGNPQNNRVENLKWSELSNREAWSAQMAKGQLKSKNSYYYDGNYAYVKISNADITMICDKDIWEKYKTHTWFASDGYAFARVNRKVTKMHRLVVDCPEGYVVDHINRNSFDNRRENLRVTTQCVNTINKSVSSVSSTGIKGVYKSAYGYRADISVKGKRIYLGSFKTKEEAIKARAVAERKYHSSIIEKETLF